MKDETFAIIVVVIVFGILLLSGRTPGAMGGGLFGNGSNNYYYYYQNNTPAPPPVIIRSDLRLIAAPYMAATDIETTCPAMGGVWHYATDWVGCEGAGTTDCGTAILQAARTQCLGTNANWVCSAGNIYCRY